MEKEVTSAITWSLLDEVNDGIILAKADGDVLYSNQAALTLLGLPHQVRFFNEVSQVLASGNKWSDLLQQPLVVPLQTSHGRYLEAWSKFIEQPHGRLVYIGMRPATADENPLAHLSILAQISKEIEYEKQLKLLVHGLQTTGWQNVAISLRDPAFQPTQTVASTPSLFSNLTPQHCLALFDELTAPPYYQHGSYFVPSESSWSQQHVQSKPAADADPLRWQNNDIFCAPLYNHQQERIGLICLDKPTNGRRPDDYMRRTVELYAQFAASIVEKSQLVQQALDRSREFELLLTASNALSSSLETDNVLTVLGQHMLQAIDADGYTIYEWRSGEEKLLLLKDYALGGGPRTATGTAVAVPNPAALEPLLQDQIPLSLNQAQATAVGLPIPAWLNTDLAYNSLILPLVVGGETYALIHLVTREQRQINQREIRLLTALTNQAGSALETALIFEDTYERERFYGAMGNVSLALNYTLDRHAVLSLICSESLRIFNVDGAYIWQLENEAFTGSAAKGHGEEQFIGQTLPLSESNTFVAQVVEIGLGTYLNNVQNSPVQLFLPGTEQIQAVLGVPLEAEGNLIGVLLLTDNKQATRFTERDVTQVTTFGVQVAIALQNAKLFEELRQLNEELDLRVAKRTKALHEESNRVKILLRITTELSASLDQDRVLSKALNLVNEVANASDGVILLVNPETDEFDFRASLNPERQVAHRPIPSGLNRNEGLAGWMLQNRTAVIVHDTKQDPRWLELPTSSSYRSVLGVPLISNEDVIGVLMLFHNQTNAFTNHQLDLVEAAAIQVANAINNASLYNLIFDQADQLGTMLRGESVQKANLQAILESIADGVIVANNKNEIEIANASASAILDIPRQQLIGKAINQLLGVYGQFGDIWMSTINDWANNSDRLTQGVFLADQLAIEDKYVSINLAPVLSEGNFFGTVSIFRDITKDVEVDRLKSEFVSTVSHELRTPMTSIKGYADLMLMGAAGQLTDPQSRYLKVIKSNADRLHDLVNDLLNISRIETGKTALDLRPLDIAQIIEQIVGHIHGRIQHEAKPMQISTDIAPGLPLVNADQARVTQILTNLADNAFNYTPINGRITIRANAAQNHVYLSVQDSGIGIAKENQDKIFDRFFRAEDEAVQKVSGTGLGLAIVRSLIEMHSGNLTVESDLGKGATFTFNLPVVVQDSDPT